MRRLLAAIVLLGLTLSACGGTGSQVHSAQPSSAPTADATTVVNNLNPCKIVTIADLKRVFTSATGIENIAPEDVNNPPANGIADERNCGYNVTLTGQFGANPSDTTYSFTVMVTTYGEDGNGDVWRGYTMQGWPPANGIGDGAYHGDNPGDLYVHKGTHTFHIWSIGDVGNPPQLDDKAAKSLAMLALTHIPG